MNVLSIQNVKETPSKQDLTRILRAVHKDNKRDAALLEFLAATGLRASEVAGLTVSDVELNERSGWAIVRGKGRKQRRVPVHARAQPPPAIMAPTMQKKQMPNKSHIVQFPIISVSSLV